MEQIWWNRVPSAVRFITDVSESLLSGRSVILQSAKDIPWHSYMTDAIRETVKQSDAYKDFREADNIDDPGAYLLQTFCEPERRTEYRPAKSYARFFAENDNMVLHQTYLWVNVRSREQLDAWAQFASEYAKERDRRCEKAVFLLEWIGAEPMQCQRGVQLYSLDKYIHEYDKIVFCTLASSSVRESDLIRKYLTELAVHCAGDDVELCAACLERYEDFLASPWGTIKQSIHDSLRSDGSAYHFDKTEEEIGRMTWLAQIRTVYPALEEYREAFVAQYTEPIARQLPISSNHGEMYEQPSDVELGVLKYMADAGELRLKQKEYDRLALYKNARNNLSHLTPLTIDEIRGLI